VRVAVVGHVEWVEFLSIDGPLGSGAIRHGRSLGLEAAGGGGVSVVDLARMVGRATLFTGVGSDELGAQVAPALAAHGVVVEGEVAAGPHRRAVTLVEPSGERTIVVIGEAQAPHDLDPGHFEGVDGVYFCKGDAASLVAARRARVLVATARCLPVIREAGVRLDALVHSGVDPSERYGPGDLAVEPDLVATTEGAAGGRYRTATTAGRWAAAPLPGPIADAYGCGDSFAAGLTVGLAQGRSVDEALALGAQRGALALTRTGAHGSCLGGRA
jgi:ribokinase